MTPAFRGISLCFAGSIAVGLRHCGRRSLWEKAAYFLAARKQRGGEERGNGRGKYPLKACPQ